MRSAVLSSSAVSLRNSPVSQKYSSAKNSFLYCSTGLKGSVNSVDDTLGILPSRTYYRYYYYYYWSGEHRHNPAGPTAVAAKTIISSGSPYASHNDIEAFSPKVESTRLALSFLFVAEERGERKGTFKFRGYHLIGKITPRTGHELSDLSSRSSSSSLAIVRGCVGSAYSTSSTQEACAGSYRMYGPHPATYELDDHTQSRLDVSAVKDLDNELWELMIC